MESQITAQISLKDNYLEVSINGGVSEPLYKLILTPKDGTSLPENGEWPGFLRDWLSDWTSLHGAIDVNDETKTRLEPV